MNQELLKEGRHPSQTLVTCPYCRFETGIGNAIRWHFSNCKNSNCKTIKGFDIDGVIYNGDDMPGLIPNPDDIIITGRSFQEKKETEKMLRERKIYNRVYFNTCSFLAKTREKGGKHKAKVLNTFEKVRIFYEDDPLQADIIRKECVHVTVIVLDNPLVDK